jgi:hypothetical protein
MAPGRSAAGNGDSRSRMGVIEVLSMPCGNANTREDAMTQKRRNRLSGPRTQSLGSRSRRRMTRAEAFARAARAIYNEGLPPEEQLPPFPGDPEDRPGFPPGVREEPGD